MTQYSYLYAEHQLLSTVEDPMWRFAQQVLSKCETPQQIAIC